LELSLLILALNERRQLQDINAQHEASGKGRFRILNLFVICISSFLIKSAAMMKTHVSFRELEQQSFRTEKLVCLKKILEKKNSWVLANFKCSSQSAN